MDWRLAASEIIFGFLCPTRFPLGQIPKLNLTESRLSFGICQTPSQRHTIAYRSVLSCSSNRKHSKLYKLSRKLTT